MTELRHHTVIANGIRQHYLEAGSGPTVVLLHGFPETSFAWRYQIPALSAKYHVIAPDLRGYGETDKPAAGYDKRTMALDLLELLKSKNIEKIALVGHDRHVPRPGLAQTGVARATPLLAQKHSGRGRLVTSTEPSGGVANFPGRRGRRGTELLHRLRPQQ